MHARAERLTLRARRERMLAAAPPETFFVGSAIFPLPRALATAGGERLTRHHAAVNPKGLGFPLSAVVRVAPDSRQLQKIPEIARQTPEVVECHRITGEDCFFLKLHLRSIDDLEDILDRFTQYGRTTTSLVHSSPVPGRAAPLDDSAD